jgi:hypothetical protein
MLSHTKNADGECKSAIGLIRPIRHILKSPISNLKSSSAPLRLGRVPLRKDSLIEKHVFAKRTQIPTQATTNQIDMHFTNLPIKANQGNSNLFKVPPQSFKVFLDFLRLFKPVMRIKRLFFVSLHGLSASVISPPRRARRDPQFQTLPAKNRPKPTVSSLCKV